MSDFSYINSTDGPVVKGLEPLEIRFAESQEQYETLRGLRSTAREGLVMTRWSPTPQQRKAIARGEDIFLELMTWRGDLQPIRMSVCGDPNADAVAVAYGLDVSGFRVIPIPAGEYAPGQAFTLPSAEKRDDAPPPTEFPPAE